MKRPTGFDRTPEQERPVFEVPAAPAKPAASAKPAAPPAPRASRSLSAALAPGGVPPAPAETPPSGRGDASARRGAPELRDAPAQSEAPDPGAHAGGDLAPTIDLSEVREARGAALEPGTRGSRASLARLRAAREADPVKAAERRVREAGKLRRARIRSERRRFSADARRRRRNGLIVLGAVAALALFVVAGAFTPLMAVRDVQIVGAATVNQSDLEQALARFDGRPLALVDDTEVHRALEPFPLIQRYAVERVPPHTLVVRIEERVPVLSMQLGEGSYAFYDAAGVLLGSADAPPAGVPVAGGSVTDLSSAAFRSAARALRDMPADLRAQIAAVSATSAQNVTFTLASGVEVFWGDAERTRSKAVVLQRMLSSLGDRPVQLIDVSSSEAPVFR